MRFVHTRENPDWVFVYEDGAPDEKDEHGAFYVAAVHNLDTFETREQYVWVRHQDLQRLDTRVRRRLALWRNNEAKMIPHLLVRV